MLLRMSTDSNIDIERFRQLLLDQRAQIESQAEERSESAATVELDQTRVGRLSRMDAMQQQAMAKATGARAQLALTRIASALQRCEDGSYGYCLRCEELINVKRLEVDPAATLCITCADADS